MTRNFHMGRGADHTPIKLENLHQDIFHMLNTSQLTKGHPPFHRICNARQQNRFEHIVARHISAASLNNINAPTLLNMQRLNENDKKIWKDSYDKE